MNNKKVLAGAKLAGGNPENGRVEDDYYATNPEAVKMLLTKYTFDAHTILEPCVGGGHIANAINDFYTTKREITGMDLVDRGYPGTIVADFLIFLTCCHAILILSNYKIYKTDKKYEGIITNPPYSLAKEFVEKGMELLEDDGQMAMFLKIQFLEGAKRKELFDKYPPKYIYVFRNRMATWNSGLEKDPKTGKRWATTMCHAWFVWEKGSTSEPVVRWL
jgi:hypothetical protein